MSNGGRRGSAVAGTSARGAAEAARLKVDEQLARWLRSELSSARPRTTSEITTVHQLRLLGGRGALLPPDQLLDLRRSVTTMVTEFVAAESVRMAREGGLSVPLTANLGTTPAGVATLFVDLVEGSPQLFQNLPRRSNVPGTGREGIFNGLLFQRLLIHHVGLHRDLVAVAEQQRGVLNQLVRSSAGGLIDLDGRPLQLQGQFLRPVKATELWLSRPPARGPLRPAAEIRLLADEDFVWDEFVDCAYSCPFRSAPGVRSVWGSLAVGAEIKRPGAAGDFPRQLGEHYPRLTGSEMLKMRMEGSAGPVLVPTRDLAFTPDDRWLVAATRSLSGSEEFDFVSTGQGGYVETYLRMGLRIETAPYDRLSALLFRARLR